MNKSCKKCSVNFEITKQDLEFYKKVSPKFDGKTFEIPAPTLCPDCRQQRRLSFRNERNLFRRKCDATGETIISMYSPDKNIKVYNQDFWWSDKWDALDYGLDFDSNKSFFEQFGELFKSVPRTGLINIQQEGTEYSNFSGWNKNSYLIFTSGKNENCFYSDRTWNSNNCVDCSTIQECDNSYNIINSNNCNNSTFLINSKNCFNSHYSDSLIGCSDCYFSNNLVNKKYYFKNKEYSKEEYFEKIKQVKVKKINFSKIKKYISGNNNENCSGDYISNSKKSFNCFYGKNIEDSKYCTNLTNVVDIYDTDFDDNSSLVYESVGSETNSNHIFNDICWINNNISYCSLCHNSQNLFACTGLKNAEYCILNKQYTKEEYNKLVPKIIEKMKETGEWGEFFPSSISPFGYNETVAQEYFPLEKNSRDVWQKHLFNWSDYESPKPNVEKIIPAEKLPENIADIPDDILNWAIKCEISGKPFRIISQELEFYRKHNLPIPRKHPDIRHLERMKLRNPRKLFDRKCNKCGVDMKSTYAPDREEIVYCEGCYEKEIY